MVESQLQFNPTTHQLEIQFQQYGLTDNITIELIQLSVIIALFLRPKVISFSCVG